MGGGIVLFGGPAGAGKSTLARAWCEKQPRSVHIQLDEVRNLIVSGRADPQVAGAVQAEQYRTSVAATCALARSFAAAGYDVAIDDVLEPGPFEEYWRPALQGSRWRLVVVLPSLEETLERSSGRRKRVQKRHTRDQHRSSSAWPDHLLIDTTGLGLEESLRLVERVLELPY